MTFSCFPGGDTPKSWAQTIFEAKPVEISPFRTERTISTKNAPCPKPLFSDRNLEIQAMPVRRYHPGSRACQVSNPTDILSQSYGLVYFWSRKRGSAKNPLCHAAFVAMGAPTES